MGFIFQWPYATFTTDRIGERISGANYTEIEGGCQEGGRWEDLSRTEGLFQYPTN